MPDGGVGGRSGVGGPCGVASRLRGVRAALKPEREQRGWQVTSVVLPLLLYTLRLRGNWM